MGGVAKTGEKRSAKPEKVLPTVVVSHWPICNPNFSFMGGVAKQRKEKT
jgi:hypothetical protein